MSAAIAKSQKRTRTATKGLTKMEYDNEKRFVLFPKHNVNPKAPQHVGTITIDGKEWEISGWNNVSKNGESYISGSAKEPFNPKPKPKFTPDDEPLPF